MSLVLVVGALVVVTLLVISMGVARSAALQEVEPLRSEIQRLQAANGALEERVARLEVNGASPYGDVGVATNAPASLEQTKPHEHRATPASELAPASVSPAAAAKNPAPTGASAPAEPTTWESWLLGRGAAVLGATVLVLAGLFFFRYGVEHGLLTRPLRVILGVVAGVGVLAGSEAVLRRRHDNLSSWVSGAGVAILYTTLWASGPLFRLIPVTLVAIAMIGLTVVCCLLALLRGARPVAALGLIGGFATPLLLSTPTEHPLGVLAYIGLLDTGLLLVARRRGWSSLALSSLAATALFQLVWLAGGVGGVVNVVAILIFAGLFVGAAGKTPQGQWAALRSTAVVAAFGFAFYVGVRSEIHIALLGLLLGSLLFGTFWLERGSEPSYVGLGASAAGAGCLGGWLVVRPLEDLNSWVLMALVSAIALGLGALAEKEPGARGPAVVLHCLAVLIFTATAAGVGRIVSPWSFVLGWIVLTVVALRSARLTERYPLFCVCAGVLGGCLGSLLLVHGGEGDGVRPLPLLAVACAVTLAYRIASWRAVDEHMERWGNHAAAVLAAVVAGSTMLAPVATRSGWDLAATLVLTTFAATFSRRTTPGFWLLVATAIAWVVQLRWTWNAGRDLPAAAAVVHAATVAAVAWRAAWLHRHRQSTTWSFVAAALGSVLFLPLLLATYELGIGPNGVALVPAGLAMAAWVTLRACSHPSADQTAARGTGPWLAASVILLGFVALNLVILDVFTAQSVLAFSLDRAPARDLTLSLSWALFSVALLVLGTLRRSSPLRKVSLVVLLATCAKVFVYDSSQLGDLYRVSSLVGLAVALIAASLFYHRHVVPRLADDARL